MKNSFHLGEGSALVLMLNPGLGCRSRETRVTETMWTYSRPCTEVALWRIGPVKSASIPQHPVHRALFGDRVTSGIAWSSLSPETLHFHSAKCAKTRHHIFHRQRCKRSGNGSLFTPAKTRWFRDTRCGWYQFPMTPYFVHNPRRLNFPMAIHSRPHSLRVNSHYCW